MLSYIIMTKPYSLKHSVLRVVIIKQVNLTEFVKGPSECPKQE